MSKCIGGVRLADLVVCLATEVLKVGFDWCVLLMLLKTVRV